MISSFACLVCEEYLNGSTAYFAQNDFFIAKFHLASLGDTRLS